jgi:hypothetical protein
MEIQFHNSSQVPLPPGETRIRALSAEPWPDGRRVAVDVQITPFQQRPDLRIHIYDAQNQKVASMGAIQILQHQIGFTLHLRHAQTSGKYRVVVDLAYPDPDLELGVVDQSETSFEIP